MTIVQGVAQHGKNHGERMRHFYVGHRGRLAIRIDRSDLHEGSPENALGE